MDTEHSERQQGKERERTVVDTEHSERYKAKRERTVVDTEHSERQQGKERERGRWWALSTLKDNKAMREDGGGH